MYDVNAVQRENIDSTESVWLCINWKWLFWKHRYFWLVLDSRIMVMNWLWIWIWRLCAPIAKLILSGCLFYKCLSHYHVTSAVQKQRSSIHRPLSPLHDQYKGGTKLEFKRHDFKNSTDSLEIHIRARWSRTAYRYEPHHGRWRVFFFYASDHLKDSFGRCSVEFYWKRTETPPDRFLSTNPFHRFRLPGPGHDRDRDPYSWMGHI